MINIISETTNNDNSIYLNFDSKADIVAKEGVEKILGYKEIKPPATINQIIENTIQMIKKLSTFKAGYVLFNTKTIEDNPSGIFIQDIFLSTGNLISQQLSNCALIAVFACSIGTEIESYIEKLINDGEITKGYIADTIASMTTDNLAQNVHTHIHSKFKKKGLKITNRYSPGYCNWDVSEQHKIFSMLPDNFCGISLTESSFMLPKKSVSGIIGIGANVKFNEYLCEKCISKDCTYRQQHT